MSKLREAAQQALEELDKCTMWNLTREQHDRNVTAIAALHAALSETPQKRDWIGLTEEELDCALESAREIKRNKSLVVQKYVFLDVTKLARAIEAKPKEKNHGQFESSSQNLATNC